MFFAKLPVHPAVLQMQVFYVVLFHNCILWRQNVYKQRWGM